MFGKINMRLFLFRRNLGGKLGHDVSSALKAEKMSDIARYSLSELQGRLGDKTGYELF